MKKQSKRKMISLLYQELIKSFFIQVFPFFTPKANTHLRDLDKEDVMKVLKDKKPYAWIEVQAEEIKFLFDQLLIQYGIKKKLSNSTKNFLHDGGFTPLTEKNIRFLSKQYFKELSRSDFLIHSYSLYRSFIVRQLFSEVTLVSPLNRDGLTTIIEDKKVIVVSLDSETLLSNMDALEDTILSTKINKTTCIALPNSDNEQWFDKLDLIKVEIMKKDFDLVLLDAGILNVHLAWFVKSMSRQAIVLDLSKII